MTQDITGSDPPVPSDNLLRERVTMFLKSINRRQNTCVCIDSKCRLFTIIHCCSEHTICNLQDDDTSWLSLSYLRRDTHALSISNLRSRCSLRKQLHKSISNPITEAKHPDIIPHRCIRGQTVNACYSPPPPPPPISDIAQFSCLRWQGYVWMSGFVFHV